MDMFKIDTDTQGKWYVYQAIDEMDKNHDIYIDRPANEGRMYKVPGEEQPLNSRRSKLKTQLYTSKLFSTSSRDKVRPYM